jgi:hypothetical protein
MSTDDVVRGAVRRSSTQPTKTNEQEARQLLYESLNERRLTRERVMASLLACPGARTSGRPNGRDS